MIIQVDQEGEKVIKQFCHLALMHAGIDNLNSVNLVLSTLVLLSKPKPLPTDLPIQPKHPGQPEQPPQETSAEKSEQSEQDK